MENPGIAPDTFILILHFNYQQAMTRLAMLPYQKEGEDLVSKYMQAYITRIKKLI